MMKISEFAQKTGKSIETLRRWDKKGLIVPNRTLSGQREYDESHYRQYLELENLKNVDRNVLILELLTYEEHPVVGEKMLSKVHEQHIINLSAITNIMFSKENNYIHFADISLGNDKIRVSLGNYKNHLILGEKHSHLVNELDSYLNNVEYVLSSIKDQNDALEIDDTIRHPKLEDTIVEGTIVEDTIVEDEGILKISRIPYFEEEVTPQSSIVMNEQDVVNLIEKKLKEYGFLS